MVQTPALHLTLQSVIDALVRTCPQAHHGLVRHEPQDVVQRLFASQPPLRTPTAEALGFGHDGTVEHLVRRAMEH